MKQTICHDVLQWTLIAIGGAMSVAGIGVGAAAASATAAVARGTFCAVKAAQMSISSFAVGSIGGALSLGTAITVQALPNGTTLGDFKAEFDRNKREQLKKIGEKLRDKIKSENDMRGFGCYWRYTGTLSLCQDVTFIEVDVREDHIRVDKYTRTVWTGATAGSNRDYTVGQDKWKMENLYTSHYINVKYEIVGGKRGRDDDCSSRKRSRRS